MGSGKTKISNRVGYVNRVGYIEFIKKYPNSGISYKEYISILKESNICIKNYILTNELGFKLPYNLGYIAVMKFKQKENYVVTDWVNSRKFKKFIPLTNLHSFGWMYKIKIFKNPRIKPLQVYNVDIHRLVKRELAKKIKEGGSNYLELDHSYFNKRFAIDTVMKNYGK